MIIEIRLYKRWDLDLLALKGAGYNMSSIFKQVICSYANEIPIHLLVDEIINFDITDVKSIHLRFSIPNSDKNACFMLKNIKKRYRNAFCKMLVRNALIQQNLNIYFDDNALYNLQDVNLRSKYINYKDLYPLSDFKEVNKSFNIGNKNIKIVNEAYKKRNIPTYQNFEKQNENVVTTPVNKKAQSNINTNSTPRIDLGLKEPKINTMENTDNAETADIMAMFDAL